MLETLSLNRLTIYLTHLVQSRLWLKVIIGLILGALLGIVINPSFGWLSQNAAEMLASWIELPGSIFMKLVQMIMIPLIFASIITGIVSNVSDEFQRFGLALLGYFVLTTVIAISIGVGVAYIMTPGRYVESFGGSSATDEAEVPSGPEINVFQNIPESISNLIPSNPLESILSGEMLSVVIFTVIIGIAITQLQVKTARPLVHFVESIQKICMIIVGWAMRLVPYAVFGLMAALLSRTGIEIFVGLGYYMLVVLVGLIILLAVYILLYAVLTRNNPFKFLSAIRDAQLLAFSTASSAAVMPLSMKIADENLKVSSKVSDFVIPIGATINMDGTALFQCVTVLFLAQAYGVELQMTNLALITVTVVAASIGTPAIPGGGVIILASVLQSTGIPADGLIVIIGIDRMLGMFRTAVNVTGDLTATAIFNKWFGEPSKPVSNANVATN